MEQYYKKKKLQVSGPVGPQLLLLLLLFYYYFRLAFYPLGPGGGEVTCIIAALSAWTRLPYPQEPQYSTWIYFQFCHWHWDWDWSSLHLACLVTNLNFHHGGAPVGWLQSSETKSEAEIEEMLKVFFGSKPMQCWPQYFQNSKCWSLD